MTALSPRVRQAVLVFFLSITPISHAQLNNTDPLNISFTLSAPTPPLSFFSEPWGFAPDDGLPATAACSPAFTLFAITFGQGNRKHGKTQHQQAPGQPSHDFPSTSKKGGLSASSNSEPLATGSGEEPPETPGEEACFTSTGITFQHLIEQINQLMEKLPENAVLTLVCDKDDTLLEEDDDLKAGSAFVRKQFTQWVNAWRSKGRLKFIVVTHAALRDNNWDHFPENHLPIPDFLVSVPPPGNHSRPAFIAPGGEQFFSEGALLPMGFYLEGETIANLECYFLFEKYGRFLQRLFEGAHLQALAHLFAERNSEPTVNLASIETTGTPGQLELAFTFSKDSPTPENDITNAIRRLFGQMVALSFSQYNPQRVTATFPRTKGEWLSVLANALSLNGTPYVIVAGNAPPDITMMHPTQNAKYDVLLPVLVGNADDETRALSNDMFISPSPYLTGVMEGILKALQKSVAERALDH